MRVTDEAGVRTIVFDRPDVLNAMTLETATDLAAAIEAVDPGDHDAIVLTGDGRAFCAGGDLQAMTEREETSEAAYARLTESFGRVVEAILGSPVPVVSEVNGDAVGAGFSLVAISDFAFAAEPARFSAAFVRIGLVPDTGGTFLLPRIVGLRAAKDLAFTGRFLDAHEAEALGLVNGVAAPDALTETVDAQIEVLRNCPTKTIGLIKRAFHENLGSHWREALDYEAHVQALAYSTTEHAEGVAAFLEDRDPVFD